MDSKKIGERLILLRGNRTREEVANSLDISRSAIAMYELGERIPRDEVKIRMAEFFGTTVQEIFFTN